MSIRVNEDYLPLIIEEYEGDTTIEDMVWHRKFVCDVLERGERYAVFYDCRFGMPMSQEQRKIDAEFIKKNREILKELAIGVAFVISSTLLRVALNFIFFLAPLPMPNIVTKDPTEAKEWLEERFKEAGIAFPDGAHEYIEKLGQRTAA